MALSVFGFPAAAAPLLPPVQPEILLQMTNANVRIEYDLSTGRANFLLAKQPENFRFLCRRRLATYVTGTIYTNSHLMVTTNQVIVNLHGLICRR